MKTPQEIRSAIECAYRRGYLHGYQSGMNDGSSGRFTGSELDEHRDELIVWRLSDCSEVKIPPSIIQKLLNL